MAKIELKYDQMVAISNQMSSQAKSFEGNHAQLKASVSTLGGNFSGRIPDVMLEELNSMNKSVNQMQESLQSLAKLALQAANMLKQADDATAGHINNGSEGTSSGGGSGTSSGQSGTADADIQRRVNELKSKYPAGKRGDSVSVGHGASQCMGYAKNYLADLHGIKGGFVPSKWPKVSASQVQAGDYVRFQSSTAGGITNHSIVITEVKGNTVTYTDYTSGDGIRYKTVSLSDLAAWIAKPLSSTYGTGGKATGETGNGYISRYPG